MADPNHDASPQGAGLGFPVVGEIRSPVKGDAGGHWWR
jgi:hypothetical protein